MKLILRFCLALILLSSILSSGPLSGQSGKSRPARAPESARKERESDREQDRPGGISEDEGEEVLLREQFIHDRRAGGPGKLIEPGSYERAVRDLSKMRSARAGTRLSASYPSWQNVNNGGMKYTSVIYVSGRSNSIAFHPSDPLTMYLGTAGGGVWKTTDGGINWSPKTDGMTTMASGAVAVDPVDPNIVYWATGEQNYSLDSYYGDGVFRSTDGGDTWTKIATASFGGYFSAVRINPANTSNIYIAGSNGVFRTTNGGTTWINTNSGSGVNCLIMNPSNPATLYITTGGSGDNSVKKSTNGGVSWSVLGWPASSAGRCQLAMAPSDTNILYGGCDIAGSVGGVYRSIDAGASWTRQNGSLDYMSAQAWYDNAIVVNPSDPANVIVGGLDLYSSTDGGVSFAKRTDWTSSSSANFTHADIHNLTYGGSSLYCLSDGGVYKSTNNGVSWKDLNQTLNTLQYQGADYDALHPWIVSGGMQDNGKSKTKNSGTLVSQVWGGDGGYTIIDAVSPRYYYSQYVNGTVERSTDSGLTYTRIQPAGSGGLFYNPFEIAPGDPNTMVYAQNDVWITHNLRTATSSSWTRVGAANLTGNNSVSAVAISPLNSSKIYVGTSNGVIYTTTDAGTSWITKSGYSYVSDLVVDRDNDNVAYAVFGGAGTHVARTTNGGVTWSNIGAGLPNIAVNSIAIRQTAPRYLIVGNDVGVFASSNEGATWSEFGQGLPICAVFDLKYKEGPKILLAATHGRGCWTLDLSQLALGMNPAQLNFGNIPAGVTSVETVAVSNASGSPVNISSVESDNALFDVSPASGFIAAGDTARFVVSFTPKTFGPVSAHLTFVNDGPTSPDVLLIAGTGMDGGFSADKPTLAFKARRLGGTTPDSVKVTNSGNEMLRISGVSSTSAEFHVVGVTDSIAPGSFRRYTIEFTPTAPGPLEGDVVFSTDEYSGGDTVHVSGIGSVATLSVSVLRDIDGDLGTTGDQIPKPWQLKIYRDSVSAGTLVESVVASAYDFELTSSGTYIISEADSGTTWVRANGNHTVYDTLVIADNQTLSSVFINKYFTVPLAFTSRWNLVSAPVVRNNYSLGVLYPTSTSGLFRFDTSAGYQETFAFTPGTGYWLKFDSPLIDTIYGSPLPAQTMGVAAGWNLVGMISSPLAGSAVVTSPSDNVVSQYWSYDNGYRLADTLRPGRAYWVKAAGSGMLTMDPLNAGRAMPKGSDQLRNAASITVTDAKGAAQTLWFDSKAAPGVNEQLFVMPPAPPAGGFDLRFDSQNALAIIEPGASARIQISGAVYPLSVTWDLASSSQSWSLSGGKAFSAVLDRSSHTVVIKNSSVKSLMLSPAGAAIPAVFGLSQNYPNPFNPSTAIRYQIPEESRVTIAIFNALGQEVRSLFSGTQDAGYKQIEWNSTDNAGNTLPSGVYICRMEATSTAAVANTFGQSVKMLLVK